MHKRRKVRAVKVSWAWSPRSVDLSHGHEEGADSRADGGGDVSTLEEWNGREDLPVD